MLDGLTPMPQRHRYCLMAVDRAVADSESTWPGIVSAHHLGTIIACAMSQRALGRRFVIWDRSIQCAITPSDAGIMGG